MNTLNTLPSNLRNLSLVTLACSSLLLTGCLEEAQELANSVADGEAVVGIGNLVIEGTGEDANAIVVSGSVTGTGSDDGSITITGEGTSEVIPQNTVSGIERLRTTVYAEYKFENDPTILEEILDLSQASIDNFEGIEILNTQLPDSYIECADLEIETGTDTETFLCARLFEDETVILKVFDVFSNNQGQGVFEICTPGMEFDICLDNFITSPDGIMALSLGAPIAIASESMSRMQTQSGAYMQYLKQGETEYGNDLGKGYDMNAVADVAAELLK